jgi:hypothetical protein
MRRLTHALLACIPLITMEYPIAPDFMPQGKATIKIEVLWCEGQPGLVQIKRTMFVLDKQLGPTDIQYIQPDGTLTYPDVGNGGQ